MYRIKFQSDISREPWNIPVLDRIQMVYNSHKQHMRVALLIYTRPDTSTFRYRAYNVQQATERSQEWKTVYFFQKELNAVFDLLEIADLLVFCRTKWCIEYDYIAHKAKNAGIPVLYDVDDLVFSLDYLPLLVNSLNVPIHLDDYENNEVHYDFWFADISRIHHMAKMADGFIATNPYLGNKMTDIFDKPFGVIENFLNEEQIMYSDKCLNYKKKMVSLNPFEIGYFSGTPSHVNDFRKVAPEINEFLLDYHDAVLRVVGFMEFPTYMKPMLEKGRIKFTPLVDFLELQRLTAQVDVSIVPLIDNVFTNCKSELKYFEASIVCTPTIATPIYSYAHSIQHGVTGILCREGQWYGALKELYTNQVNALNMAASANQYCRKRYFGRDVVQMIEKCYNNFV